MLIFILIHADDSCKDISALNVRQKKNITIASDVLST